MAGKTEEQLIAKAREAVSDCNWVVGECAADWTTKYAKGRTDADFGMLIGLSGDQIYQRRRVWERFGKTYDQFPKLKWSHYYVALNWDDATDCLNWSNENESTVAEMRAWRRAVHGEDLSTEPESEYTEWATPLSVTSDGSSTFVVQDPETFGRGGGARSGDSDRSPAEVMAAAAREFGDDYAPFRADAGSVPKSIPEDHPPMVRSKPEPPDADQLVRRAASGLQRIAESLTPDVLDAIGEAPQKVQQRLFESFESISELLTPLAEEFEPEAVEA